MLPEITEDIFHFIAKPYHFRNITFEVLLSILQRKRDNTVFYGSE